MNHYPVWPRTHSEIPRKGNHLLPSASSVLRFQACTIREGSPSQSVQGMPNFQHEENLLPWKEKQVGKAEEADRNQAVAASSKHPFFVCFVFCFVLAGMGFLRRKLWSLC